ncbi:MAG: hypothetical protein LQ339_008841 [Xanthoria mediterranea]|nr:MAG: hypothetical protein LQ339_008841 [Xanthoria mediterranea]
MIKEDVTTTISAILVKSYGPDITEASPVENEYAYGAGRLTIPRLLPHSKINNILNGKPEALEETVARFHQALRSFKLHVGKPGLLNSLAFVDDKIIERQLDDDEIEMETRAFGITFRDVLIALGQMKGSTLISGECSGIVTAVGSELRPTYRVGDRVCAWYATPYASRARVKGSNAYPIPKNMSFSMAASIPVVFLTAFYSLVEVARLRAGQTVLIHSAAGGLGQAAILIAKSYQATIFATVGNSSKRDILTSKYQIPSENIFLSRSRSFKPALLHRTAGKGVDVVLNSLAGEALLESWECVARFGTFVEIGKSDIYRNTQLGMKPFDRNVTFASVDLLALADFRPEYIQSLFKKVISEIESGCWELTEPSSIRGIADIEDAFRSIQMRKHTGKLILEADEHSSVKVASPPKAPTKLDPSGAYVVAGGLGSLGRKIVTFLIEEGARHIIVLSRKGRDSKERAQYEAEIALLTAEVHIETCDITNSSHVQELAAQIQERTLLIKGVIQGAMVLQVSEYPDSRCWLFCHVKGRVLERMSVAEFEKVVGPKVAGSANLNRAFANPSLDFFVMLSSYGGIVGSTELANYAAANTYQDELA